MADERPITLNEGNDETVELTINRQDTDDDLTTVDEVQFWMKVEQCDTDLEAALVLTSATPAQLVILTQSASQITAEAYIPASALVGSYPRFYRVDGISTSGARRTALFGTVTVNDL